MIKNGQCEQCGEPFEYEWIERPHRKCESCKVQVRRSAVRRCKSANRRKQQAAGKTPHAATLDSQKVIWQDDGIREARVKIGVLDAIAAMTRQQVATALGTTYDIVRTAEERALWKLRRHPELMRLWLRYREQGGGVPVREDAGEQLLEYQLNISKWYRLAERLREAGCEEESAECIELIERFWHKLGEAVVK